MKRVSSRLREAGRPLVSSISKCLIQTAPVGKSQLPSRLNMMVWLTSGSENQRDLIALSDQNGTLTSYGTIPSVTVSVAGSVNAPVSASVGGNGAPLVVAL